MAMSGINVSKCCEEAHDRQHKKKDVQWTIYMIADCKTDQNCGQVKSKNPKQEITTEHVETRRCCADTFKGREVDEVKAEVRKLWQDFIDSLPDMEPRYAVFDYVMPTKSGTFTDKMRFVAWSPDDGNIKKKMLYASSKETILKKLDITHQVHLSSKSADELNEAFEIMWNDKK